MEDSRVRKLRAIERWRSRKEQKDEKSDDRDDGCGFEVGSKKVKGKKMGEIDSEKDVTLCVSPKVETTITPVAKGPFSGSSTVARPK